MHAPSSLIMALLFSAIWALEDELANADGILLEATDLFNSDIDPIANDSDIDPIANDNDIPGDATWSAPLSLDEYTSGNKALLSSRPADLLSSDQPSPCYTDETSVNVFSRSDNSDFCFQEPNGKSTPPLAFPNLFNLLQPDPNNLVPSQLYRQSRPVCPGYAKFWRLCCAPGGDFQHVYQCEICTRTFLVQVLQSLF